MAEPRTEAGRVYHSTVHRSAAPDPCPVLDIVLAIEAGARAQRDAELRAAVETMPTARSSASRWDLVSRKAVVALLVRTPGESEGDGG